MTEGSGESTGEVVGLDRRELLIRHAAGDKAAFSELMESYRAPVYTYLIRCGVPPASRDDLFQEIFIKIHLGASSYTPEKPLANWLFTIVANTTRSFFRKEKVRALLGGKATSGERTAASPDELLEAKETAGFVGEALQKLPFKQRQILLLCTTAGLSQEEVADMLGLPLNTIKTCLRRARLFLASSLANKNQLSRQEVKR